MSINIYENKPFRVYSADYFSGSNITSSIGLYFITDKQSLFKSYVRTNQDGGRENLPGHTSIIEEIDSKIYVDNEKNPNTSRRPYNTYIYLSKDYNSNYMQYLISLPENGHISLSEYKFLTKALDELDGYNKYACLPEEKCKYISILSGELDKDDLSVEEARKVINKFKIGYPVFHKETTNSDTLWENGIGSEFLSEEEIIETIKYYVDFSKCKDFNDLVNTFYICDKYYSDSYYRNIFMKIFPDYLEVASLVNEIIKLNIGNFELSNLTFDNIYDVLNGIYMDMSPVKMAR